MDKVDVYRVLGKVGPNEWKLVNEIYEDFSHLCFEFYYEKQAEEVRRDLKNYLAKYRSAYKVPISVVRVQKQVEKDFGRCENSPQHTIRDKDRTD